MRIVKFYSHFAAAFGSIVMLMLLLSFITHSRIDLGVLGLLGIPIACAIYAHQRMKGNKKLENLIGEIGDRLDRLCARFGLFGHQK
jgi:hypothetical protein